MTASILDDTLSHFGKNDEPLVCTLRRQLGDTKWYGMSAHERRAIAESFIDSLSDSSSNTGSIQRQGVKTRFRRLLASLGELNANNGVALWTRYFWNFQIAKILRGEPYNPSALEIDLTTYCDSGCFFCKEGQEKKAVQYPFTKLELDLLEFSAIPETCLVIYSGGGEPTCFKHFRYTMQMAREYGYAIYVSTHGGSIGLKHLPHDIFTENCTILKLSIDGATHATYNTVHNPHRAVSPGAPRSVDYIFRQVRAIADHRRIVKSMGISIKLPRLLIAMTVSPVNQHEVILMTERAIEAGADTVLFRPIITIHQPLLAIDEGLQQMNEARERYGQQIEILTFNHRLDYGYQREDHFGRCICHPVTNPNSADGRAGSITPCLFRRGNRPQNTWLSGGEPNKFALSHILGSKEYQFKAREQDNNLHANSEKRCPRCRKVVNNIFLDILFQASSIEREIMRTVVMTLFPRNPIGEIIRGLH